MEDMTNLDLSSRKLRKPLMERKRRARINRSLDELYELLRETDFAERGLKLEKADILEMTVEYFKQVKQHGDSREARENMENVLLERYLSGFERCAEEIETLVHPRLRHGLHRHLQNCLERVKTQQREKERGVDDNPPWKPCPVLIQEPKDLRTLPSKLANGDVLLLLSSSDRPDRFEKVWRPWW